MLVDSAVYLRDYAQLIKQMRDIRFFDENMGKNMYNFVADNINDIVRLTHDMKLTNKMADRCLRKIALIIMVALP